MKTTWLRPNGQGLPPVFWLGLVTLAGWTLCTTGPGVLLALGIHDYNWWFLDSYAVLAAGDAARAGLSPDAPNPFDPLLRNNKYSDWWYALNWLGLTRAHNFAVGLAWVGAFALAVGRTLTPRSWRETAWLAVLLLSPPVLMAVNRANNDLVIFVLLAVCGSWAVVPGWRQWVAVGALALATGLKFYPAPGCLALAGVRPGRRMPWLLLAAGLAVGGALGAVWAQMARGRFPLPCGLHVMGALSLGQKWGWTNPTTTAVFFAMVLLGAGVLVGTGVTVGLAERGGAAERLRAALGSLVLLACFGAGNSFGYRWILALWMGLWLWRRSAETPGGGGQGGGSDWEPVCSGLAAGATACLPS